MAKLVVILIIALTFEAVGVVLLSAGLKEIGEIKSITPGEIGRIILRGACNAKILAGMVLETIFFIGLLTLLKKHDVSLIWPLTSLGFVLTTLSARFLLHEQVPAGRWCGVGLIVLGAALVSWTERNRTPSTPPPGNIESTLSAAVSPTVPSPDGTSGEPGPKP